MYKELCTRKKNDKSGFGDKIHDYTLTIPMNQKSQPKQGSLILYLICKIWVLSVLWLTYDQVYYTDCLDLLNIQPCSCVIFSPTLNPNFQVNNKIKQT